MIRNNIAANGNTETKNISNNNQNHSEITVKKYKKRLKYLSYRQQRTENYAYPC